MERTAIVVREGLDAPPDRERFRPFLEGDATFGQFAEVLDETIDALSGQDPSTACWNFTGTDQTAGFWRRRVANEVAVHRVDAERAAGQAAGVPAERAVDGIDELLTVMLATSAPHKKPDLSASVHLHCTDVDGEWMTVFASGHPTTTREHAKGDLAVRGPASSLFLWAWNRQPADEGGLEALGDTTLLDAWASIVP